jgi:hypothetical protein
MPELWTSLLTDARAAGKPPSFRSSNAASPTSNAMCCASGARIVEMRKVDAVEYFGADALWKNVSQRLLDQTYTNRSGSHDEDGCWPDWGETT